MFPNDDIARLAIAAQQQLAAGNWRAARPLFEQATQAAPNVAALWVQLAATYHAEGQLTETSRFLAKALPLVSTGMEYLSLLRSAEQFLIDAARKAADADNDDSGRRVSPVNADIELTAHCQLKCPFCRTGALRHDYREVPRGLMTEATLRRTLQQLPNLFMARIYNWGEPFLHPKVDRMIAIIREHGVHVEASSNMQLMSPERAAAVVAAGLDRLTVSCDGISQQTYEKYRVGGSLTRLLENVAMVVEAKRQARSILPIIVFQIVVSRDNEGDLPGYQAFAQLHGADAINPVGISGMTDEGYATLADFIPKTVDLGHQVRDRALTGCREPWYHVSVDWNGDLYTSCNPSGMTHLKMGNLNDQPIADIWSNDRYRQARRMIKSGVPEPDQPTLACHGCHHREMTGGNLSLRLASNS